MNQHTNAFWQIGSVPSTPVRSFHFKFFQRMWQKISPYTAVPVGGALTNDCKPTALFVVHTRLEREAQVSLFPALPQAGLKWWCVERKASTVAIMEDCQHTVAKKKKEKSKKNCFGSRLTKSKHGETQPSWLGCTGISLPSQLLCVSICSQTNKQWENKKKRISVYKV